ncbi:hypothetical protein AAY473_018533 [Plecturocebus cupreus]
MLRTAWYLGSCCSFQQALQKPSAQLKRRGRSVSRQRKYRARSWGLWKSSTWMKASGGRNFS